MSDVKRYSGRVVSLHDGYGFIGLAGVTQDNGSPHDLATEVDVFVHRKQSAVELTVGLRVTFEVAPSREEDQLQALKVEAEPELMPAGGDEEVVGAMLIRKDVGLELTVREGRNPMGYLPMKHVPAGTLLQVKQSGLLEGVPSDDEVLPEISDEEAVAHGFSKYLYGEFETIQGVTGVDFSVHGTSETSDDLILAEITSLKEFGMPLPSADLKRDLPLFQETRRLLAWILDEGLIKPGSQLHPILVAQLIKTIQGQDSVGAKKQTLERFKTQYEFMREHELLRPNTILPNRYLPHFALATPVWYLAAMGKNSSVRPMQQTKVNDPHVHDAVARICGLFPKNRRWADFFQMFNRRLRTLENYTGLETPPAHIRRIFKEASQVYDQVWVTTTHLDVAGADWRDAAWVRGIDPYVLGFINGHDSFSILGRYVRPEGVYPHYHELVADVIEFLRTNKQNLLGFDRVDKPYWHNGNVENSNISLMGTHLVKFVDELLQAVDQGILPGWICGERDLLPEPPKSADKPPESLIPPVHPDA